MAPYEWICHVCNTTNPSSTVRCTHCGFPASSTGEHIYAARREAAGLPPERARRVPSPYHTVWRRFFAGLIDGLVFAPLTLVEFLIIDQVSGPGVVVTWYMISTFSPVAYTIVLHGFFGQTIGKWLMRVKVFDVSGAKLSMKQAVLRDSVLLALMIVVAVADLPRVASGENPYENDNLGVLHWIFLYASLCWFSMEIVTMLFNEKRRAVHDFIAGSVVMRMDSRAIRGESA